MIRAVLLGLLFLFTAGLYLTLNAGEPEAHKEDPLASWDMRNSIQSASDDERNPWRRDR